MALMSFRSPALSHQRRLRPQLARGASLLSLLLLAACRDDDEDLVETINSQPPPVVEIISVQNAAGVRIESADEALELTCDRRISVLVGPTSVDSDGDLQEGYLHHFLWGPPGTCGQFLPCGYVRIEALDAQGEVIERTVAGATTKVRAEAPLLNIVLSLAEVELTEVAQLRAQLIQGNTGDLYQPKDTPIEGFFPLTLSSVQDCDSGMGGMAGMSGLGGAGSF